MSKLKAAMIGVLLLSGTATGAQAQVTGPMAGMSAYIRHWGVGDEGMDTRSLAYLFTAIRSADLGMFTIMPALPPTGQSDIGILGSYDFALFPYALSAPRPFMIPERTSDQRAPGAVIVTPEPSTTAMLAAGMIVFGIALSYRVRRARAAQHRLAERLR